LKILKSGDQKDKAEIGKRLPGIYAFDGDNLKPCIGVATRPTSIDTRGNPDTVSLVLQRPKC
jgi:hypothetical protein